MIHTPKFDSHWLRPQWSFGHQTARLQRQTSSQLAAQAGRNIDDNNADTADMFKTFDASTMYMAIQAVLFLYASDNSSNHANSLETGGRR